MREKTNDQGWILTPSGEPRGYIESEVLTFPHLVFLRFEVWLGVRRSGGEDRCPGVEGALTAGRGAADIGRRTVVARFFLGGACAMGARCRVRDGSVEAFRSTRFDAGGLVTRAGI